MSQTINNNAFATHVQNRLNALGESLKVDGNAGKLTLAAFDRHLPAPARNPNPPANEASTVTPPITFSGNRVDDRSEKNIATLLPHVQPIARALVQQAAAKGITIKIISGTRNKDEQNALYAKGRTTPGPKVTNAKFGFSNHNFGIAFDIGIFEGTQYIPESPLYKTVGAMGKILGLEWGGDWKTIVDEPHFQLRPAWAKGMTESTMLINLRAGHSVA